MKTALTEPELPSVTDTSLIERGTFGRFTASMPVKLTGWTPGELMAPSGGVVSPETVRPSVS